MSMYVGGDKINAIYMRKVLSPGDTISYNDLTDKPFIPSAVTDLSDADNYVLKTEIKTVNGNSLIGSGNLDIDGLPSQTGNSGKFLTTNGTTASWATVDALPSQSGNSGKFLTTDGSSASWATVSIPTVDQTYSSSSTSTNALSHKAIADAKFLQNTATVLTSLTLLGTPTNKLNAINIGGSSSVSDSAGIAIGGASTAALYGISIGYSAYGSKLGSIALGSFSYATAIGAIQLAAIGNNQNVNATNSEAGSFYVALYDGDSTSGNYKLLGADGKIPDDRLNTTIARTSQIPTVDQTYDGTSSNAQSGVAIAGAGFLQNTATRTDSLTILGTGTNKTSSINIGPSTSCGGYSSIAIGDMATTGTDANRSIAIGQGATSTGGASISIGYSSRCSGLGSIQLGTGMSSEQYTFYVGFPDSVGNYKLLGSDGKIPDARLSTNIARTSDYYTKAEVDAMIGNIEAILQRLNSGNNS